MSAAVPAFAGFPATLPAVLDVRSEVTRLRSDIAFFDLEASRLEGEVAQTGSPALRIALMAARVARSVTSKALDSWLAGYN